MTSGTVQTNTEYESYFYVNWSQVSQDKNLNKTTVRYECGVYCGHNFYNNAISMSAVSINGSQVYAGGTYSQFMRGNHVIASGNVDISHSNDGSGSITISAFTGWLYQSHNYSASAKTFALDTIVRGAVVVSTISFNNNTVQNPSVRFDYNGSDQLKATLEYGNKVLGGQIIPTPYTTEDGHYKYTYDLTTAEKSEILNDCPGNEFSQPIYLVITTIKDGNEIYRSYGETSYTVNQTSALLPTAYISIYSGGTIYKNVTEIGIKVSGTAKQGASIYRCNLEIPDTYNGSVSNGIVENFVVSKSGTITITGTVTDTRGFSSTATQTITVTDYVYPDIAPIRLFRCDYDDVNHEVIPKANGLYVAFEATVTGQGNLTFVERHRESGTSWGNTWYTVSHWSDISNPNIYFTHCNPATYDPAASETYADVTKAYDFEFKLTDSDGFTDFYSASVPSESVTLHLGNGGKNVAIGKFADTSRPNLFESAWLALLKGGATISCDSSSADIKNYAKSLDDGFTPFDDKNYGWDFGFVFKCHTTLNGSEIVLIRIVRIDIASSSTIYFHEGYCETANPTFWIWNDYYINMTGGS